MKVFTQLRGAPFLIAAGVVVSAVAIFGEVAESVRENDTLVDVDQRVLDRIATERTGWGTSAAREISRLCVKRWHKTLRVDFLTGKTFTSIDDAEAQLDAWAPEAAPVPSTTRRVGQNGLISFAAAKYRAAPRKTTTKMKASAKPL